MFKKARGTLLLFGVAGMLAMAAWLVGFATALQVAPQGPPPSEGSPGTPPPERGAQLSDFGLYTEAWSIINHEFYGDRPDPREITDRAVEGMVEALDDPYSAFLDHDAAADARADFEPEVVGGVGAWVEPVADGALVIAVVPGTPAEQAGLLPGDILLAAGQDPLSQLDHDGMMNLLRGPAGMSVVLIVHRGRAVPFAVEVARDEFELPGVELRRPTDGVAYLRISHFSAEVVTELDQALETLSGEDLRSLIIDLRDNPGGELDSVRSAAGRFIDGQLYVEVDREGSETARAVDSAGAPAVRLPDQLIVLINGGTASAAEMLAGALHDAAGARLVGSTTFGKGSLQLTEQLSDGSVLRLTIAAWRTPAGRAIEGVGLDPDLVVEVTAEDREAGRDPQLEAALGAATTAATTAGG